jgi:hypothetical protein
MKRLLFLGLVLLATAGCQKDIHLRALPALAGTGHASVKVVLTYDRNNLLTISLSGVKDGRYVAWTTPTGGDPVNVGQIRVEGGKGKIETLTPLRKFSAMITEEENGAARKPSARVVFQSEKEIEW